MYCLCTKVSAFICLDAYFSPSGVFTPDCRQSSTSGWFGKCFYSYMAPFSSSIPLKGLFNYTPTLTHTLVMQPSHHNLNWCSFTQIDGTTFWASVPLLKDTLICGPEELGHRAADLRISGRPALSVGRLFYDFGDDERNKNSLVQPELFKTFWRDNDANANSGRASDYPYPEWTFPC